MTGSTAGKDARSSSLDGARPDAARPDTARPDTACTEAARLDAALLVLAAGRSRRFGTDDKRLALWRGRPLLAHVLDRVSSLSVPLGVVIGARDSDTIDRLIAVHARGARVIRNPDPAAGLASSLGVGLHVLQGREAVVVCLGDMPCVRTNTIAALLDAAAASPDHAMLFPVHDGERGNPVLIRSALFADVLALTGDGGARRLARRWPERVLDVPVDDPGVLLDVDTPEALKALGE